MKKQIININGEEIKILIDEEEKQVKVGNLLFEKLTDFIYYVNKLTDIAEELNGDE